MARQQMTEDELLSPTKYKVDHGTMTLHPEKSIPTMQITMSGSPPVFLREGEFYSQDGSGYDFTHFPGGYDGLIEHLRKTANPAILAMHGLGSANTAENGGAKPKPVEVQTPQAKHPRLENLRPADTSGDADLVLEVLADREMDMDSLIAVAGISAGRVKVAIDLLGDQIERFGEGKRGIPFLYRKAMPSE